MGGAEGVVDVHVRQAREPLGEAGIVVLLPGVEAEVLEHDDLTRARPGDQTLHRLADAVGRELDRDAERTAQVVGDGTERQLRRRPALRAAQVRGDDRQAAVLEDVADRR